MSDRIDEFGRHVNQGRPPPQRLQSQSAIDKALEGMGIPDTPPRRGTRNPNRITAQQEDIWYRVWSRTNNAEEASRRAGVSGATGKRLAKKYRDNQNAILSAPPPPIPYKKLSMPARRAMDMEHPLEAFRYWHEFFMGLEWAPWKSYLANELLMAYLSPDDEYLVVNVGPGFGKSTVLFSAELWIASWERCRGEDFTALLGHLAERVAESYVGRVAKFVVTRKLLLEHFGRYRPLLKSPGIPWSNQAILFEPLDYDVGSEKEPTFSAWGSGSAFQGMRFKWNRWDDLLDLKNQTTPGQREQVKTFWNMMAEPRMNEGGVTILSNVRVHPLDLSHELLSVKRENDDGEVTGNEYRRVVIPAHHPSLCGKAPDGSATHSGPWPAGCLTEPKRGKWARLRHAMKDRRTYELMFQQQDVSVDGRMEGVWIDGGTDSKGMPCPGCLDRERAFWQLPERPDASAPAMAFITIDPSDVKNWALQYVLWYPDDTFVVLAAVHTPLTGPMLLYRGLDGNFTGMLEEWFQKGIELGVPFNLLIVESVWGSRSLAQWPFFQDWLAARGVHMEGHETNENKGNFFTGVDNLVSGVLHQGRWRIPLAGPAEILFAESFKAEVVGFPEAATDDIMMSTWFPLHRFDYYRELALARRGRTLNVPVPQWAREVAGAADVAAPSWAAEQLGTHDVVEMV